VSGGNVVSTGWADTKTDEPVRSRKRHSAKTTNCRVIRCLAPHAGTGNEGASAFGRAAPAFVVTDRSTPPLSDFKIPKQMSA